METVVSSSSATIMSSSSPFSNFSLKRTFPSRPFHFPLASKGIDFFLFFRFPTISRQPNKDFFYLLVSIRNMFRFPGKENESINNPDSDSKEINSLPILSNRHLSLSPLSKVYSLSLSLSLSLRY